MPFQDLVVTEERLAEEKVEREKPVTVWKRDKELGFGEFDVADVPYDGGYRRQFLMGNRKEEDQRCGCGWQVAYDHFVELVGVPVTRLEGNPHNRPDNIGGMFGFESNGQSIDGNLRILYMSATGVLVNLYSDKPIPQGLTDRACKGFAEYCNNWN